MAKNGKPDLSNSKKFIHPNSRKSKAICKKLNRQEHKKKNKLNQTLKQSLLVDKMVWVKDNMVPDVCPYTEELTAELLKKYISRNDEELEQIEIKHSIGNRKNRQHANREDILKMNKKSEIEEYETCGIEIPDILNAAQCSLLRNWDGDAKFLPNFKFRRFGQKHLNEKLNKVEKNETVEKPMDCEQQSE